MKLGEINYKVITMFSGSLPTFFFSSRSSFRYLSISLFLSPFEFLLHQFSNDELLTSFFFMSDIWLLHYSLNRRN